MIVKSMSRKTASFGQLIRYMESGSSDERFSFYHNLYPDSGSALQREFELNAERLPLRKNGVYLYHEILSVTRAEKIPPERQKQILSEIVDQYVSVRAPNSLVYGVVHDEKDNNLHYHLLISSNALGSEKRHRISKHDFNQAKKSLEKWVLDTYPEMEQSVAIDKPRETRETDKGVELRKRTGKTPQKDQVKSTLRGIFTHSRSKEAFFSALAEHKMEIYQRGKTIGFRDLESGRKYRLKTLGLEAEFSRMSHGIELEGKQDFIDYQSGVGKKDRVEKDSPSEKPNKVSEDAVKNPDIPKQKPKKTEKQAPSTDAIREAEDDVKFGRYGTLKEWLTGDFSDRETHQKEQRKRTEELKREARYQARREAEKKEREIEQVQKSTRDRARRVSISAEVEKRKQEFRNTRNTQNRPGKSNDSPDME